MPYSPQKKNGVVIPALQDGSNKFWVQSNGISIELCLPPGPRSNAPGGLLYQVLFLYIFKRPRLIWHGLCLY